MRCLITRARVEWSVTHDDTRWADSTPRAWPRAAAPPRVSCDNVPAALYEHSTIHENRNTAVSSMYRYRQSHTHTGSGKNVLAYVATTTQTVLVNETKEIRVCVFCAGRCGLVRRESDYGVDRACRTRSTHTSHAHINRPHASIPYP